MTIEEHDRLAYPVNEAARLIGGLSRSTVYELIKSGEIKVIKVGTRTLIPRGELEVFIAARLERTAVSGGGDAS